MRLISRLSNGMQKMLKLPQRFIPPLISKLRNPHRNVRIFLIPLGFEVIIKIRIYPLLIPNGDTLEDDWPYFDENDAVVSNPPYHSHGVLQIKMPILVMPVFIS